MELNSISRTRGNKVSRRVGRGSKRGKTSGRGGKGQTARAGNKRRPEWRDIIKKIPKRRGYGRNRSRTFRPVMRAVAVNLDDLQTRFVENEVVSPRSLFTKKLVRPVSGKLPPVKILGSGALSTKLALEGVSVSKAAQEAILKAGGTIKA